MNYFAVFLAQIQREVGPKLTRSGKNNRTKRQLIDSCFNLTGIVINQDWICKSSKRPHGIWQMAVELALDVEHKTTTTSYVTHGTLPI